MKTLSKYDLIFLFILLCGLTGMLLLYAYQGIGLTNDSGFYVYAGCYDFMHEPTGRSLSIFPPLYPSLLGLLHFITGLSPLTCASVINIIAYLFFAWGIYLSGKEHFKSDLYRNIFYAVVLLGIPILFNAYMLWSEMVFISILWFCLRYLGLALKEESNNNMLLFAVFFLLCFFTRYAALGLLPGIYLLFLLNFKKYKVKSYAIVITFTAVLPALWLLRNYLTGNGAPYDKATLSITDNLLQNTEVFSHFILADQLPDLIGSISIIALFFILILVAFKEKRQIFTLHLFIILSYTLFLIILNSIKDIQIPDERYYSVIYPSFFLIFFIAVEKRHSNAGSPLFKVLIMTMVITWLIYPLARSYKNTADFIQRGIGYQDEEWRNSSLIQNTKSLQGKLISNNPLPVILFGREATTHTVPLPAGNEIVYMLWWDFEGLPYLPSDKGEWVKYYNFERINYSSQGQLYRLTRK